MSLVVRYALFRGVLIYKWFHCTRKGHLGTKALYCPVLMYCENMKFYINFGTIKPVLWEVFSIVSNICPLYKSVH